MTHDTDRQILPKQRVETSDRHGQEEDNWLLDQRDLDGVNTEGDIHLHTDQSALVLHQTDDAVMAGQSPLMSYHWQMSSQASLTMLLQPVSILQQMVISL